MTVLATTTLAVVARFSLRKGRFGVFIQNGLMALENTNKAPNVTSGLRHFSRHMEPVPNPGFRQEIFRIGWVLLDFLTQLIDENAQVFDLFPIIGSPHGLQKLRVR